jgi:hypothetical protein
VPISAVAPTRRFHNSHPSAARTRGPRTPEGRRSRVSEASSPWVDRTTGTSRDRQGRMRES